MSDGRPTFNEAEDPYNLIQVWGLCDYVKEQSPRDRTHWDGCYTVHAGCLAALIQDTLEEDDEP